jgi:hypothetical protein
MLQIYKNCSKNTQGSNIVVFYGYYIITVNAWSVMLESTKHNSHARKNEIAYIEQATKRTRIETTYTV